MTKDDVIEMLAKVYGVAWTSKAQLRDLTAFANLVTEKAVRESSAEYRLGWNDGQIDEREACAGLRKEVALQGKHTTDYEEGFWDGLEKYEDLIKARGLT
jgi:hypothetical protein